MLKYFNEELQGKEIRVPFKSTLSKEDKVRDKDRAGYTASCLHSESYESKSHKRVYCSENHRPSQCKKVTNRQSRIDILKISYRCFLCLKSEHTLKTCSAKYICRKCNRKHHISICDKGEKPQFCLTQEVSGAMSMKKVRKHLKSDSHLPEKNSFYLLQ